MIRSRRLLVETERILEAGQIADWVIEQMEHSLLDRLQGKCEASSYDISGNCWKQFNQLNEKIANNAKLVKLLENQQEIVHLDKLGLDDFQALVIAKLLRYRNSCAKLLDLNNNGEPII